MKWFKHITASWDDTKLSSVIDEHGLAGYGFWWRLLEIIASKMDENGQPEHTLSLKGWATLFRRNSKSFQKFLETFENYKLTTVTKSGNSITIKVPNLLKYRDEWTIRKNRKSGETTEQERCKEKESESEKKEKKKKSYPQAVDKSVELCNAELVRQSGTEFGRQAEAEGWLEIFRENVEIVLDGYAKSYQNEQIHWIEFEFTNEEFEEMRAEALQKINISNGSALPPMKIPVEGKRTVTPRLVASPVPPLPPLSAETQEKMLSNMWLDNRKI